MAAPGVRSSPGPGSRLTEVATPASSEPHEATASAAIKPRRTRCLNRLNVDIRSGLRVRSGSRCDPCDCDLRRFSPMCEEPRCATCSGDSAHAPPSRERSASRVDRSLSRASPLRFPCKASVSARWLETLASDEPRSSGSAPAGRSLRLTEAGGSGLPTDAPPPRPKQSPRHPRSRRSQIALSDDLASAVADAPIIWERRLDAATLNPRGVSCGAAVWRPGAVFLTADRLAAVTPASHQGL
jgi:hypothetical protein